MGDVEKRLQLALAAAGMAVWDATLPGGEVEHATLRLSPEGAALLGLEPRALTLSLDDYLAYIHPDDRHTALVKARCHIERGQDYQLEYRIVGKTLIIRDVEADIIVDFVPNAIQ